MSSLFNPKTLLLIPGIPGLYLLVSSGYELFPVYGVFNTKRLLEPLVWAGISGLALASPLARGALARLLTTIPGWLAAGLLVMLLAGLASALRFPHPGYGIADVLTLAVMVSSMLVVAACRHLTGAGFDRLVLGFVAMLGIIVAVQEFMGLLAGWAQGFEQSYANMLIRFAHPRFYNQLQSWSLLLLATLPFVFPERRYMKRLAVILLGIQWALLIMSGGRGSFLSLVTALLLLAFLAPHSRQHWGKIHIGGFLLGGILYLLILAGHHFFVPGGGGFVEQSIGRELFHSTGRTHLWQMAMEDGLAHPLLGVGPMRFDCDGLAILPAHPHSFVFRILAEWGFPVLFIVLAMSGFLAWKIIGRAIDRERVLEQGDSLRSMLTASVFAAGIHACLSGLLTMPASQVMAVLICGWLLGLEAHGEAGARPGNTSAFLVCATSLLIALGIFGFNVSEIRQFESRTAQLQKASVANPRYWQHGRSCLYTYPPPQQR